jgi:hypothetical protein
MGKGDQKCIADGTGDRTLAQLKVMIYVGKKAGHS